MRIRTPSLCSRFCFAHHISASFLLKTVHFKLCCMMCKVSLCVLKNSPDMSM